MGVKVGINGFGRSAFRRMQDVEGMEVEAINDVFTDAVKAIGLILPELKGRLDGASQRVPVSTTSHLDSFLMRLKQKF